MGISKEAIIKSIKEALRVVAIAVIPITIDGIQRGRLDWQIVGIVGSVAFLRWADKLLHEVGKETKNKTLIAGLTRF